MNPFAAYTAAETPNVFQWSGQLPKIAPRRGGHVSLGRDNASQSPNGISIGSVVFIQLTRVSNTQTHRQTVRPHYVRHRIYAMRAMRPKIFS